MICFAPFSVFRHLRKMRLPRQETRRFRSRHRRSSRREKDRERADGSQQSAKDQGRNIAVRTNVKQSAFDLEFSILAFHFCGLFIYTIYRVILQISKFVTKYADCENEGLTHARPHCNISKSYICTKSRSVTYHNEIIIS